MKKEQKKSNQELVGQDNTIEEKHGQVVKQAAEQEDGSEAEQVYQIFDKIFKKVLTLSAKAVLNFINGLFGMDYPLDSKITYNWTEFEDDRLRRILADTILTINGIHSYHLEAQMEKDNSIVFRVFDYGFHHASRTRVMDAEQGKYVLRFPKPVIIYLYYEGNVPDYYTLTLEKDDGTLMCEYEVPVVKLPEISAEELNDRKMVVLLPFHVLKCRKLIKKGKITDISELKRIVENDIIGSINRNVELGNIEQEDAFKLKRYLQSLCRYLVKHHKELEAMRDMTDESFMTDADIICETYEQKLAEKDEKLAEKDKKLAAKNKEMTKKLAEKDKKLAKKDEEMAKQSAMIKQLQQQIKQLKEQRA